MNIFDDNTWCKAEGCKTLEDLEVKLFIHSKKHPVHDLYILDYDQINSPKTHPVVRLCRGLVVDSTGNVISGCMERFFNVGEIDDNYFNYENVLYLEKLDGSLIYITYYQNRILVRTRFSWAGTIVGESGKTWEEIVLSCLTDYQKELIFNNCNLTYGFELCSPYNQVVVYHETPKLYLLTIIDKYNLEYAPGRVDMVASSAKFVRPRRYSFTSYKYLQDHMDVMEANQDTNEGFVLYDGTSKLKIKNKFYLRMHRLAGNGNIGSLKNLIEIVLKGETSEVIGYFPHVRFRLLSIEDEVEHQFNKFAALAYRVWYIKDQKEFAQTIIPQTEFSGILFNIRKHETELTDHILKEYWGRYSDYVFKVLLKTLTNLI